MRGSLRPYYTRLYFSDEAEANQKDEILNIIPKERTQTLIAEQRKNQGITEYHFDIYMQGKNETVFFEV
jgi:protocatechuate 3,4-dioxygenase alpha subunit